MIGSLKRIKRPTKVSKALSPPHIANFELIHTARLDILTVDEDTFSWLYQNHH